MRLRVGLGPRECQFQVICSGPHWRFRAYGGPDARPSLLMVPAPIKRPYIWDLTPSVSAVRYCLHQGFRVHLLEWTPPSPDGSMICRFAVYRPPDKIIRQMSSRSGSSSHTFASDSCPPFTRSRVRHLPKRSRTRAICEPPARVQLGPGPTSILLRGNAPEYTK